MTDDSGLVPSGLALSGLTRRYGSLTAVDGVSLDLATGARHAVIGPNGAGKSTLLNLIAGTARAQRGRVVLDGRDLTRAGPARRGRLGIARSFQQPSVIADLTVRENLVMAVWRHHPRRRGAWRSPGRYRECAAEAERQLEAVGLRDLASAPASALSHGQRRLLDLGAALVARPRVLLLDEPAAGLTDEDVERFVELLGGLPDEVAVLLVEHNTELVARLADTVTVLVEGRALVTAPTGEALSHPAVREAYLGTAAAEEDDEPCSNSAD
ncbi:ABC transporter ATP-binding protein [Streptomyces albiaxialis]|uniref:ABC transporter ATP-binding protein n=1 Tax=Streptomyces albiaxialis TaxID=329523 RepID=A0ABN2WA55_9ACTN